MKKTQKLQNPKAGKFQEFLEENNIQVFTSEAIEDEPKSVIFRSRLAVGGQELPMLVAIDNSIYTMIRVQIAGGALREENKEALGELIQSYNRTYKIFKYYLTQQGDLCLDCCLPFTEESFDSAMVRTILQVVLQHLTEAYPAIMSCVWGGARAEAAAAQQV